ncbi:MAG: hypothetical protein OHK0023_13040 [Anaerolineae bacterium]
MLKFERIKMLVHLSIVAAVMLGALTPIIVSAASLTTVRISTTSAGGQATGGNSNFPDISADGRYVAYESAATNLVSGDTNGAIDIFLRDLGVGTTLRVSVGAGGVQANGASGRVSLSNDGRYIAFDSVATNLVAGDTNARSDIFVYDQVLGTTTRVSVSSGGVQADNDSFSPSISGDGRYVAFRSDATNLVAGDTNARKDIFVRDLTAGTTTRVSISTAGVQSNDDSFAPSISDDGRYIAFESLANNLVGGDTNGQQDIFVYDRNTGITARVSVGTGNVQAAGGSVSAAISADGRYVAFQSSADNLILADTNSSDDIFLHDRTTGQTTRVSLGSDGAQGNGSSRFPDISGTGRYITFFSLASNLVSGDGNGIEDVFIHDRATGNTRLLSRSSGGVIGNGVSGNPVISSDGRQVAFESAATNLVSGDTNSVRDIFVSTQGIDNDTIGVFRPSVQTFYLRYVNAGGIADVITEFGRSTDLPIAGDWDADGIDTIGVYRPSLGLFILNSQNNDGIADIYIQFPQNGGLPVVGDWDGDGFDTVGVYREGVFFLRNSNTSGFPDIFIFFGDSALDIPVAGDWNGDDIDTVGLWRASAASFYLTNRSVSGDGTVDLSINYGSSEDVGFIGDWDGDGISGLGVYRPSNGDVYLKQGLSGGLPEILFNYGIAQDKPIAGVWQASGADEGGSSNNAPIFVPKQ